MSPSYLYFRSMIILLGRLPPGRAITSGSHHNTLVRITTLSLGLVPHSLRLTPSSYSLYDVSSPSSGLSSPLPNNQLVPSPHVMTSLRHAGEVWRDKRTRENWKTDLRVSYERVYEFCLPWEVPSWCLLSPLRL